MRYAPGFRSPPVNPYDGHLAPRSSRYRFHSALVGLYLAECLKLSGVQPLNDSLIVIPSPGVVDKFLDGIISRGRLVVGGS